MCNYPQVLALATAFVALIPLLDGSLDRRAPMESFYIGTYTSPAGSRGIYEARLDPGSGEISHIQLAVEADSPSYVAISPNGKFLYAVRESSEGEVSSYAIKPDQTLDFLNRQSVKGAGPCFVSLDQSGTHLFVASYNSGSFACLPIRLDGSLGAPTCIVKNAGSGPNRNRQEASHLHSIYPDPKGRFVYACDLGTDEVLILKFDRATGKLAANYPRAAHVAPGSGPRHLAFHPGGKFLYVNSEMASTVTAFKVDSAGGSLTEFQVISTLAEGSPTAGKTTAEIACHPNGKWLYVSNRGDDSIAVFGISGNGHLKLVEIQPAGVREPRGFAIDPTGKWLVVAGQNSNDVTALSINPKSGRLTSSAQKVSVGSPVCIAFRHS